MFCSPTNFLSLSNLHMHVYHPHAHTHINGCTCHGLLFGQGMKTHLNKNSIRYIYGCEQKNMNRIPKKIRTYFQVFQLSFFQRKARTLDYRVCQGENTVFTKAMCKNYGPAEGNSSTKSNCRSFEFMSAWHITVWAG